MAEPPRNRTGFLLHGRWTPSLEERGPADRRRPRPRRLKRRPRPAQGRRKDLGARFGWQEAPNPRRTTTRLAKTLALIAGAVLAAGTAVPAEAAATKIDLRGATVGSYTLDADGSARVTGDVVGKPFAGPYTAVLTPADGTLPEPGVCEPATATVDVTGERGRFLHLAATGEVCGKWTGPNSVVTHKLISRYQVVDSSVRSTLRTDGWIGIILALDNRANLEAIDT